MENSTQEKIEDQRLEKVVTDIVELAQQIKLVIPNISVATGCVGDYLLLEHMTQEVFKKYTNG